VGLRLAGVFAAVVVSQTPMRQVERTHAVGPPRARAMLVEALDRIVEYQGAL
jgi:hypothetical protein